MRTISAVTLAALYGILIRILFGYIGDIMGIMSLSFLVIGPFAIGFLTVILLPKKRYLSNGSAFFLPWLSCLVILLITVLFNVEGTICWIMIFPFFATLAGAGGILANKMRRKKEDIIDHENHDYWTKPDKMAVSVVMLFPMLIGIIEGERTLTRKEMNISREVLISATPQQVWNALGNISKIDKKGSGFSLSAMLGFPRHQQTTLDIFALGGKRKALYEKGLYFDETITGYIPLKQMVLDIKTDPSQIPPNVMDEHILIGGKHVDILQDTYSLETLSSGRCRLTLSSHFYINTPFNWYAGIWANYLMKDILQEELNQIMARASK